MKHLMAELSCDLQKGSQGSVHSNVSTSQTAHMHEGTCQDTHVGSECLAPLTADCQSDDSGLGSSMSGEDETKSGEHFDDEDGDEGNTSTRRSSRLRGKREYDLRDSSLINRLETEKRIVAPRQPKPKSRPPPLSKYRRRSANTRERDRMKQINDAFEALRHCVPALPLGIRAATAPGTKLPTKITTIRMAINYIAALRDMLGYEAIIIPDVSLLPALAADSEFVCPDPVMTALPTYSSVSSFSGSSLTPAALKYEYAPSFPVSDASREIQPKTKTNTKRGTKRSTTKTTTKSAKRKKIVAMDTLATSHAITSSETVTPPSHTTMTTLISCLEARTCNDTPWLARLSPDTPVAPRDQTLYSQYAKSTLQTDPIINHMDQLFHTDGVMSRPIESSIPVETTYSPIQYVVDDRTSVSMSVQRPTPCDEPRELTSVQPSVLNDVTCVPTSVNQSVLTDLLSQPPQSLFQEELDTTGITLSILDEFIASSSSTTDIQDCFNNGRFMIS